MGIFNDYTREGKGIDKGPDFRPRIVVFFDIYFRKFWNLVLLNLLYILFCIPVVTIGPATAALTKVLRNYAREEHSFIWADFWNTFKQNFWTGFFIGLIDAVALFVLWIDFASYWNMQASSIMVTISLTVIMLTATVLLFMNYYLFVMMVTFKLSFKQLLKIAFIFAWVGFFRNLLITILIAIISAICLVLILGQSPAGAFIVMFIIFLYFSTCGLICNFITYPLIKKHMIDGYDPETGEKLDK